MMNPFLLDIIITHSPEYERQKTKNTRKRFEIILQNVHTQKKDVNLRPEIQPQNRISCATVIPKLMSIVQANCKEAVRCARNRTGGVILRALPRRGRHAPAKFSPREGSCILSMRYEQLNLCQGDAAVCAKLTQDKGRETWMPGR